MSRDLDETIQYHKGIADKYESRAKCHSRPQPGVYGSGRSYLRLMECVREHRQLAEWLEELKYYKDRQDLINKSWQELIRYKEGIEKIKMRSQSYRDCGESILANGMEQALNILMEVNADEDSN